MLAALLAVVAIVAVVYLFGALWRAVEATLQGVVGGVVLVVRTIGWLCRTSWRFVRFVAPLVPGAARCARWSHTFGVWLARRSHAAWWVHSYRYKRRFLASMIRSYRRRQRQP